MKKKITIQLGALALTIVVLALIGHGLEGHFRELYPMDLEDSSASSFYTAIYVIENLYTLFLMGVAAVGLGHIFAGQRD